MKKNVFENQFTHAALENKLSGFTKGESRSLYKKSNPGLIEDVKSMLPSGYVRDLGDKIESAEVIYSASSAGNLVSIAVGRNDRYQGNETYDYDMFSISPNGGDPNLYDETQWFHFKDDQGNRTSAPLTSGTVTDATVLKSITYDVHLTGDTQSMTHADFELKKNNVIAWHNRAFHLMSKENE